MNPTTKRNLVTEDCRISPDPKVTYVWNKGTYCIFILQIHLGVGWLGSLKIPSSR